MKIKVALITFGMVLGLSAFAHEGHDHAPGMENAPHGGTIKKGKFLSFEIVTTGSELKVYPFVNEKKTNLKPVPVSEVKLLGNYQIPKKKKVAVTFTSQEDYFVAKIDAKGAYRYALDLNATYKGKTDKVTVQVEPQQ